jgi:hypothetical protein
MSRVITGLALAVGLAGLIGSATFGQDAGTSGAVRGDASAVAAKSAPEGRGSRAEPASRGPRGSSEGAAVSTTRGGPSTDVGGAGGPVAVRRSFEPPDPKAAMVAIQAVFVEFVQEEPEAAAKTKPDSPAANAKSSATPQAKLDLGPIDLDLAAPTETILAELHKLGVHGRLDVLNRVQLTTLDKRLAQVDFGRQQSYVSGTSRTSFGAVNNITQISLGFIVGVTPAVMPSGAVVLQVNLSESRPGPIDEGAVISKSNDGETIRQPVIVRALVQSTVAVPPGKTVLVASRSEAGPRQTQTLLLVSAHVINAKTE